MWIFVDAARSVAGAEIPDFVELEWVVQIDGECDAHVEGVLAEARKVLCERFGADILRVESHMYCAGAAVARNLAVSRAVGDVLVMVDGDDVVDSMFFAKTLQFLREHEDVDFVYVQAWQFSDGENDVDPESKSGWVTGRVPQVALQQAFFEKTVHFPAAPVTVRSDVFWKVGGYTALASNEDTNLLVKLDSGFCGWFIDEPLYGYRRWGGQHTREDVFLNEILAE